MIDPDEFILEHAQRPYDPVKRREYYLRTRQLKGRKSGSAAKAGSRRPASAKTKGRALTGKAMTPAAKRRAEAEVRVKALQMKLDRLRGILRRLVDQAKRRSGGEVKPRKTEGAPAKETATKSTKTKASSPTTSTKKTDTKPKTATQKREAREASAKYYEENLKAMPGKSKLGNKEDLLKADIAEVKEKIEKARANLKRSVDKARNDVNGTTKPAKKSRQPSLER